MSSANPQIAGRKIGAGVPVEPLAYRVNDACRVLSVSRSHLYALAAKGEIKLTHIGNRTLVSLAEIHRLLGETPEAA
ncbi:helix-turn-helix domain-containing protein [Methylocystis echinoides]|uniref:helix-turn-helix domain-containing protein n=1 Tax=Methylocystis echinoides TaxID=29468 RepID=UPI003443143A